MCFGGATTATSGGGTLRRDQHTNEPCPYTQIAIVFGREQGDITGQEIYRNVIDVCTDTMDESSNTDDGSVSTTVELSGTYEQIEKILGQDRQRGLEMGSVVDDMNAVLDIVRRTDGATKSKIAADLPASTTAEFDADSVIHVLRVLEVYELVTLDGNTWRVGPAAKHE